MARMQAIGLRFGRLTVLADAYSRSGKRYVRAACDCGTEKVIGLGALREGTIKSCGCYRQEHHAAVVAETRAELVGQRHHGWIVIGLSDRRTDLQDGFVIARCECGTEREVILRTIRAGNPRDCGCVRRDHRDGMDLCEFGMLLGSTFGRLTVTGIADDVDAAGAPLLAVSCSCGTITEKSRGYLWDSNEPSCGCIAIVHGLTDTHEYQTWKCMVRRCHNPEDKHFVKYGARGITVCDRWRLGEDGKTGVECFVEDMGCRPPDKQSIDRLDGTKGYAPGNCRWATWQEQVETRLPRGYWKNRERQGASTTEATGAC